AASTTVTSATAIDLGHGSSGSPLFKGELLLTAPAVTTTMAPDTKTITYNIITSDNSDLSSPTTIAGSLIVQTGAGGAGAATATARFKPASNCKRYVGFTIVSGANITDSSAVSATFEGV